MAFIAAVAVAGCAGFPVPPGPDLTAEEIRAGLVGRPLKGISVGERYTVTSVEMYSPAGTLESDWTSGDKGGHWSGTYAIHGTKLHITDTAKGTSDDDTIRQQDGKYYFIGENGAVKWIDTPVGG